MGAKRLAAEAGDWEAPAPFDVPLLPKASAFLIESKLYRLRALDGPCASSSWFDYGGIVAADAKDAFAPFEVLPSPSLGANWAASIRKGRGVASRVPSTKAPCASSGARLSRGRSRSE